MIEAVRAWLSSIVVASVLVSVARTLMPEGTVRRIGSFTGGLILALALLRPLRGIGSALPELDFGAYEAAIAQRRMELDAQEADTFQVLAAERFAALIREKAAQEGKELEAVVTVRMEGAAGEEVPLPWSVTLRGTWDASIAAWIESELGIPPSRQTWTPAPPPVPDSIPPSG